MYVDVRRTYKFRMYRNDKRDGHLHQQINVAGLLWNHALALQRRYYRLTGKYIGLGRGSSNRRKAAWMLARTHIRVDDKRRDFHFQLAHDLCDKYDVLVFETLNAPGHRRILQEAT